MIEDTQDLKPCVECGKNPIFVHDTRKYKFVKEKN